MRNIDLVGWSDMCTVDHDLFRRPQSRKAVLKAFEINLVVVVVSLCFLYTRIREVILEAVVAMPEEKPSNPKKPLEKHFLLPAGMLLRAVF